MECSVRGSYPGISRPLTCGANDGESAPTVLDARREPSASRDPERRARGRRSRPGRAAARRSRRTAATARRSGRAGRTPWPTRSCRPPRSCRCRARRSGRWRRARRPGRSPRTSGRARTRSRTRPGPSCPGRPGRCARSRSCRTRSCCGRPGACPPRRPPPRSASWLSARRPAPSKVAAWKFRVGSVLIALNASRLASVPSSRYFAVAGPNDRSRRSRAAASTLPGSAVATLAAARTAIAFRFLAPMTAPSPPRPACRPSCEIVAYRTPRSPAGPIAATRQPRPSSFLSCLSVSSALRPVSPSRGPAAVPSPSMSRADGFASPCPGSRSRRDR